MIEEQISFEDFKEHRFQIEAERARQRNTVDAIRQRQHLVKADYEIALQLATKLNFLYEKGTFDEKRLLGDTVFKCLYVETGGRFDFPVRFFPHTRQPTYASLVSIL